MILRHSFHFLKIRVMLEQLLKWKWLEFSIGLTIV